MSAGRHLNGHGYQHGPLRPDFGDGWADLKCDECAATWTGIIGDPCGWCQDARFRLLDDQRALDARNKRLRAVPDDPDEPSDDDSDWAPIGLADIATAMRTGDYQQITPTVLAVEGSNPLLYPERINSLFGESGGGKTWVALAAVAEVARAGERALLIDYEDTPAGIAERLVLMGLSDEEIALVDYRNPTTGLGFGLEHIARNIDQANYTLVVLDSTGEAMASGAVNPNADEEVARWFRRVKELMRLPGGPAVVVLDHVPKDKDAPSSYAIGSQRKRAAVTGAAYRVDTLKEPAKGRSGKLRLTVAKDRPGNRAKGTTAAVVEIESLDDGKVAMRFHLSEAQAAKESGEKWRPTIYMERISDWLHLNPGSGHREILRGVSGKDEYLNLALDTLVEEGWVSVGTGPRGSHPHTVERRFSAATDPDQPVDNSGTSDPASVCPVIPTVGPAYGGDDPASVCPPLQGGRQRTQGETQQTLDPVENSRPPFDDEYL